MNKTLVILALLCGTATAGELTPAQKTELGKKIASLDKSIEEATAEKKEAEACGDKMEAFRATRTINGCQSIKAKIQADEALHWRKLEKNNNDAGRYWKEPKKGEKEGRWVIWQEVVS